MYFIVAFTVSFAVVWDGLSVAARIAGFSSQRRRQGLNTTRLSQDRFEQSSIDSMATLGGIEACRPSY